MNQFFALNSAVRSDAGKGVARKLRMTGTLPAILYGQKEEPVSLQIEETAMKGILRQHPDSAVVTLTIDGASEVNAIVRDVQRHPASGKLLHVDFQRVRHDEKVRVDVPVQLDGESVGVKDNGGVLEHTTRNMSLMCLPSAIPSAIILDISALEVGDTLKVKDAVALYPEVEFVDDVDTTIATVLSPVIEREVTDEETAEGAEAEGAADAAATESGSESEESK